MTKYLNLLLDEGFLSPSFISIDSPKPLSFSIYQSQIADNNIGGMNFLKEHLKKKEKLSPFKSAFVFLYPYQFKSDSLKSSLLVSLYARSGDYHLEIQNKCQEFLKKLRKDFPKHRFSFAVDSAPLLEKDLAYKAGLGWIGKNTCLIHKKHGSLFFIASVLSDMEVSSKSSFESDHCGTCNRCIDACPTQALSPRKLDVSKCISYRNIEERDYSPQNLESPTHSWFFGCDICQTVCPWNRKQHPIEELDLYQNFSVTPEVLNELKEILSSSHKALDRKYKNFALSRARAKGLKRNALKIIHENNIRELKDFLFNLEIAPELRALKDKVETSLK